MTKKVWSWREAVQKSDLPPPTKAILQNLANHMNAAGESCFPSTRLQAEETGYSERTVCTHLQKAVVAGFLKKSRHGFSGQGWARNEYFPTVPEGFELGHPKPAPKQGPENSDNPPQGTERPSAPKSDNSAKGTEPDDKKALNVLQCNYQEELPEKEGPLADAAGRHLVFEGTVLRVNARDWEALKADHSLTDEQLAALLDDRDGWLARLQPTDTRRIKPWWPTKQWLKARVGAA